MEVTSCLLLMLPKNYDDENNDKSWRTRNFKRVVTESVASPAIGHCGTCPLDSAFHPSGVGK